MHDAPRARRATSTIVRRASIAALWVGLALPAAAQERPRPASPDSQRAAMKRLEYLVGNWEGEGWNVQPNGVRETFRGSERVQSKLDGVALLVEGNFTGKPPGATEEIPVHVTLGVIHFDDAERKYRFRSWLATGSTGERELELTADGWRWGFRVPSGSVRYTMSLTPAGEWKEIGEYSSDGATWRQFFEMNLKKR